MDYSKKGNFRKASIRSDFRDTFADVAKRRLTPIIGQTYADVVASCVSGAFVNVDERGDSDERSSQVGLRYVNYIVATLERLKI